MAIECDFIGPEGHAQPRSEIPTHRVGGNGVNRKPQNNLPEGRFVQFEQVARVATAVCLAEEPLAEEPLAESEIGNHLPSCAAKLVSFVVVGTLPFVGVNFGCRKIPSAEFGFQRYPRLIGKLLLLIGELEEFVFRQMLVSPHRLRDLTPYYATDSRCPNREPYRWLANHYQ
jgi:hypothetical protein